jgi:hypothetical protein
MHGIIAAMPDRDECITFHLVQHEISHGSFQQSRIFQMTNNLGNDPLIDLFIGIEDLASYQKSGWILR